MFFVYLYYITRINLIPAMVDLDEVGIDDLIDELEYRLNGYARKSVNINKIINVIENTNTPTIVVLPTPTLADKMKADYIKELFNKYSLSELEGFFPKNLY